MSGHQVAFMATRLLALFVGISAVRHILAVAEDVLVRRSSILESAWAVAPLVSGAAALSLWFFADRVADRLVPTSAGGDVAEGPGMRIARVDVHAIALSILGFYIAMAGLSNLGAGIAGALAPPQPGFGDERFAVMLWLPQLITAGLHLALGLLLATRPRALAARLQARWRLGDGLVRVRGLELVDEARQVRATLSVEKDDVGHEDVAMTIHDEGYAPRLRLGTVGGEAGVVQFLDDEGRTLRSLTASTQDETT